MCEQPAPEQLVALGVRVRDFAYENTLPAIAPVPRVPRQSQPAPKRPHADDDPAGSLPKKPRPLERSPTEPLQEPPVQRTRTIVRLCSILALARSPAITVPPASSLPFVVHAGIDPESQPSSVRPALVHPPPYPQSASPVPPPSKELQADPCTRRHRSRRMAGPTPPSNRYQLRQRPAPSACTSTPSRRSHPGNGTAKSLPRRTHRVR